MQGRDGEGEGLSCDPSQGHKDGSFLQGQGEGLLAPQAQGCWDQKEGVAGSRPRAWLPFRPSCAVSHHGHQRSPLLTAAHICSESLTRSLCSSFTKYSREPTVRKGPQWVLGKAHGRYSS